MCAAAKEEGRKNYRLRNGAEPWARCQGRPGAQKLLAQMLPMPTVATWAGLFWSPVSKPHANDRLQKGDMISPLSDSYLSLKRSTILGSGAGLKPEIGGGGAQRASPDGTATLEETGESERARRLMTRRARLSQHKATQRSVLSSDQVTSSSRAH